VVESSEEESGSAMTTGVIVIEDSDPLKWKAEVAALLKEIIATLQTTDELPASLIVPHHTP
jgi:hypothetical protein